MHTHKHTHTQTHAHVHHVQFFPASLFTPPHPTQHSHEHTNIIHSGKRKHALTHTPRIIHTGKHKHNTHTTCTCTRKHGEHTNIHAHTHTYTQTHHAPVYLCEPLYAIQHRAVYTHTYTHSHTHTPHITHLCICASPCTPCNTGLTTSTAVHPRTGALMLPSLTTLQKKGSSI